MATKKAKATLVADLSEKAADCTRTEYRAGHRNMPRKVIKLTYEYDVFLGAFDGVNSSIQEILAQMNPDLVFAAEDLIEPSQLTLEVPVLAEMLLEYFVQLGKIPQVCVGTNSHHAKLYKLK